MTGWVERFVDTHGQVSATSTATGMEFSAADGSWASLDLWWRPPDPPVPAGSGVWRGAWALGAAALAAPPMLAVAVRRGGWAVGVVADGAERAGKAGRAYVQGRTSKGGSSQGRYQRRRGNQTDALVADAVARLRLVLADTDVMTGVEVVVTAGDRLLIRQVLERAGVELPRAGPMPVGDPRRVTLADLATRVRGVRVRVRNASALGVPGPVDGARPTT
ncbi:MAG: Vms1/Ankzf1 family peptidyl-tRNA hydrolase [Kineosporiaceae bacterium]